DRRRPLGPRRAHRTDTRQHHIAVGVAAHERLFQRRGGRRTICHGLVPAGITTDRTVTTVEPTTASWNQLPRACVYARRHAALYVRLRWRAAVQTRTLAALGDGLPKCRGSRACPSR